MKQICDVGLAVRLFYERIELSSNDVAMLFGNPSKSTVCKLKKMAKEMMAKENIMPWDSNCVNTRSAYKSWNLDIDDLEKRLKKLEKLKESAVYGT